MGNGLREQTKSIQMPRYDYRCVECMYQFSAFHGFNESLGTTRHQGRCPNCGSTLCERIPSVGFSVSGASKPNNKEPMVGEKVEDFIRESKQELKEQRRKLEDNR